MGRGIVAIILAHEGFLTLAFKLRRPNHYSPLELGEIIWIRRDATLNLYGITMQVVIETYRKAQLGHSHGRIDPALNETYS